MAGPHTARARAREQMIIEIKELALRQLATDGPAALSLRAIARELGIVSSAVYRYFDGRDALLTALIVDAYQDLGQTLNSADDGVRRTRYRLRWRRRCTELRTWAGKQPSRFQLLYGTPVPGYRAPQVTIAPAATVPLALLTIVDEAWASSSSSTPAASSSRALGRQLHDVAAGFGLRLDEHRLAVAVRAFAELIGLVVLELGGHFVGGFEPADHLFDSAVLDAADRLGLPR